MQSDFTTVCFYPNLGAHFLILSLIFFCSYPLLCGLEGLIQYHLTVMHIFGLNRCDDCKFQTLTCFCKQFWRTTADNWVSSAQKHLSSGCWGPETNKNNKEIRISKDRRQSLCRHTHHNTLKQAFKWWLRGITFYRGITGVLENTQPSLRPRESRCMNLTEDK